MHLRRGAAAEGLSAADVEDAWSDDVAAVFVTGITMVRSASAAAAVERTVARARESRRPRRGRSESAAGARRPAAFAAALAALRGRIDIAVGDADELALLAGTARRRRRRAARRWLPARRDQARRRRCGGEGRRRARTYRVPSHVGPGEVVDTIGAGDAFTAGLLAAVLDGESPDAALERGSARAAAVVRTRGDIADLEAAR